LIYFIKCNNYVKIGRSIDPKRRLADLQTGNPFKLTLIRTLNEKDFEESTLHKKFNRFRVRGEWFRYSETIKMFVANSGKQKRKIKKKKRRKVSSTRKNKRS
jgi:hypothetical protein